MHGPGSTPSHSQSQSPFGRRHANCCTPCARPDGLAKQSNTLPIQPWRFMRNILRMRKNTPIVVLFALAVVFAVPVISAAQGRGNGKGQGPNLDKKCAKFVNCHDARDGRVDGRGPAVNPVINPTVIPSTQQPNVDPWRNRRNRDRDNDTDGSYRRSRNRRVSQTSDDGTDRNDTWRHRRDRSGDPETRDRRIRRRDRNNVID